MNCRVSLSVFAAITLLGFRASSDAMPTPGWQPTFAVEHQSNQGGAVDAVAPKIASNADGSLLYYAWADARLGGSINGRPRRDVYFVNSRMVAHPARPSGDLTLMDRRLDEYGIGFHPDGDAVDVQIAASGDKVYVAWVDRLPGGSYELNVRASNWRGESGSWSDIEWVGTCQRSHALHMVADVTGAHLAWAAASRKGAPEGIRYARLAFNSAGVLGAPGSGSFYPGFLVSEGHKLVSNPQIAKSSTHVYVTYLARDSGGEDLYFRHFLLTSWTWISSPIRLNTGVALGASRLHSQRLAAGGDSICAVWVDDRAGSPALHSAASADFGVTWSAPQRISSDTAVSVRDPRLILSYNRFHAAWSEKQTGWQIRYRLAIPARYTVDWDSTSHRLDSGTGGATAPSIAGDLGNLIVCWRDERMGRPQIFGTHSNDGGTTWASGDTPITSGVAHEAPEVLMKAEEYAVVFTRFTFGTPDVWACLRYNP